MNHPDRILNEEGGTAFKHDVKTELMLRTASAMVSENSYYKSGEELDSDLRNSITAVAEVDPEFILKLAYYARTNLYLRSAPVLLMGEFALSEGNGKVPNARKYVAETIQRADEMGELIGYVMEQNKFRNIYKGKIPMVVKHGVAKAFTKFDEYQLDKYDKGFFTMKKIMNLTHPKPLTEGQAELFKKIEDRDMDEANTWERATGQKGRTKEVWEEIIPNMGYMALLRNLVNFHKAGVDMAPVLKRIADPEAVAKSKQFPYRFATAHKVLKDLGGTGRTLDALSDALDHSVKNIPELKGRTCIMCDVSGSMDDPVTSRELDDIRSGKIKKKISSLMTRKEVGCLFGAVVHKKSADSVMSLFACDHKEISLSKRDSAITNMEKMVDTELGICTYAYLAMNYLLDNDIFVDRIVLFSDMQCYDGTVSKPRYFMSNYQSNSEETIYEGLMKYRSKVNPDVFVYSFDLDSYATPQFPKDPRVCLTGGFSDQILKFIPCFEEGGDDMLKDIESVQIN